MEKAPAGTEEGRTSSGPDANGERGEIVKLASDLSVEVTLRAVGDAERSIHHFAPGTETFISQHPGLDYRESVTAATALRRMGMEPVPHVVARNLEAEKDFPDYIERLAKEASVKRILILAGDRPNAGGPFNDSLALLNTELFKANGIEHVYIAGHPEGHPKVDKPVLAEAMDRKVNALGEAGLSIGVATQICFDAAPIVDWEKSVSKYPGVTLRVGVVAPAKITSLIKFAMHCGVGNSLRTLRTRSGTVAKLLTETGPEPVILPLAKEKLQGGLPSLTSLHFYTLGGFDRAAKWIEAFRNGAFELDAKGEGFTVKRP